MNYSLKLVLASTTPVSIWVASSVPKNKGRKVIREFQARTVSDGDITQFVIPETIRELRDNHNFIIEDVSEIRDSTGCYECIEVVPFQVLRKIYPRLIARKKI